MIYGVKKEKMKYRESFLSALVIFLLSVFMQWLNWFAFEKIGYSWRYTLITPLILCLMYHLVQLDAGGKECFSRKFFFVFSAAVPFLVGILLTLIMLILNPEISNFNPEADFSGTVQEVITTYSGRIIVTSLYLMVFAVIDVPILRYIDRKKGEK